MKIRVPNYYKNFKCIADACEDTCCAGWEVVIDKEALITYKKVKGSFGERLRESIVVDDGDKIFKLKGNNCTFLNENKLCDIFTEIGEEGLCTVCKEFPRVTEEFGGLREIGLSLSCPEAARLILNNPDKIEFEINEVEEEAPSYNEIDGLTYLMLMKGRGVVFNILQQRKLPFEERTALVLLLTKELQRAIDEDNIIGMKDVIEDYLNESFISEKIKELKIYKGKEELKYEIMKEWFKVSRSLTHINEKDPLGLNVAIVTINEAAYLKSHRIFDEYYEKFQYKFEHILVYFIFRYFMKAVFDYDVKGKAKLAVVSALVIRELCVSAFVNNGGEFSSKDMVNIAHIYSKDVEHLEENVSLLYQQFDNSDYFTMEKLLVVLLN